MWLHSYMIANLQRWKWWLFGCIGLAGLLSWYEGWRSHREHSQDRPILAAATRYGVDAALIKAVVWRESWFNPSARGGAGEIGLMQVMPSTAGDWALAEHQKSFSSTELFDPYKNTSAGTWYLRRQLHHFRAADQPIVYALAAYNAGPTRAARWCRGAAATNAAAFLQQMDFPGTKQYVLSILKRSVRYRGDFSP